MSTNNSIDIKENYIKELGAELLDLLLIDRTTKKTLLWATDTYARKGYHAEDHITVFAITGKRGQVIKPRIGKSKDEIQRRTKDKAEVFTPSWICNAQNNLIDGAWFGIAGVFNIEAEKSWTTTTEKIPFPTRDGKTWQDYVKSTRLEITCGEAPYIVSRYDTVSGEIIPLSDRIGLLDRKLRVVNENAATDDEWLEWTLWAFKSVYAYDWQGDNVLLARENLLFTFIDNHVSRYSTMPPVELLTEVATIISWNVWQMDGLKYVVPNSCENKTVVIATIFGDELQGIECEGCAKNKAKMHNGIYCKVMDWETKRAVKFVNLVGKGL